MKIIGNIHKGSKEETIQLKALNNVREASSFGLGLWPSVNVIDPRNEGREHSRTWGAGGQPLHAGGRLFDFISSQPSKARGYRHPLFRP